MMSGVRDERVWRSSCSKTAKAAKLKKEEDRISVDANKRKGKVMVMVMVNRSRDGEEGRLTEPSCE